jgi:hypothetical protein
MVRSLKLRVHAQVGSNPTIDVFIVWKKIEK